MRTGNGSRTKDEPRAVGLRIEKSRLIVTLNDDREVSVPLRWYPTLQRATPSQRKDWELIGPGKGFFWQSLDLDLSVRGLISGFSKNSLLREGASVVLAGKPNAGKSSLFNALLERDR